ncbi:12303_t:CDS:2, partial [Gigaspora rosea]
MTITIKHFIFSRDIGKALIPCIECNQSRYERKWRYCHITRPINNCLPIQAGNRAEHPWETPDHEKILQSTWSITRESVRNLPIVQKTTPRDMSRLHNYDGRWNESPLANGANNTMDNDTERTQPHRIDTSIRIDYEAYYTSLYTIMKSKQSITIISEKERSSESDNEVANMVIEFEPT